jgi:hypothetical protein
MKTKFSVILLLMIAATLATPSPTSSRMEQSFSPDGGKTWEVNWICELSR